MSAAANGSIRAGPGSTPRHHAPSSGLTECGLALPLTDLSCCDRWPGTGPGAIVPGFTEQQLQDLYDLLASGELKVTHSGGGVTRSIEYSSRKDLLDAIQLIEQRLGKRTGATCSVVGWERDA